MSTYTYRFTCGSCGEDKAQTAPPDLKFILYYDESRNELDPQQVTACAKCTKIIDAHNAPIEAIIHAKQVDGKAKKKGSPAPPKAVPVKVKTTSSLPPAEQTTPDPMALLAGAIASLVKSQQETNEKLEQLINGKRETIRGPLESGGRRKDAPTSPGNQGRQATDESSSRLRKPTKRSNQTSSK